MKETQTQLGAGTGIQPRILLHTHLIPLLSVCKVVSNSVICLFQQRIITVTRSNSQQLKHPKPVTQLDPQAYGQVPREKDVLTITKIIINYCVMSFIIYINDNNVHKTGTCDPYRGTFAQLPQNCQSKLPPPPVSLTRPSVCPNV